MQHAASFGFSPLLPRRVGAGLFVGMLHALVLLALSTWAPATPQRLDTPPLQVELIAVDKPEREMWEPPRPVMASLNVSVVQPDIPLPPPDAPTTAITLPEPQPAPPVTGPTFAPKVISDVAYLQPPAPRYPVESRRSREHGLVIVRVLVDEEGRAREVQVHQSSGHPRLDRAACQAVERARFKPYVEEGVPRPAIAMVPIEFGLKSASTAQNRS
jgi:periplasmic protein TonB